MNPNDYSFDQGNLGHCGTIRLPKLILMRTILKTMSRTPLDRIDYMDQTVSSEKKKKKSLWFVKEK